MGTVSVLIVSWNTREHTLRAVRSALAECTRSDDEVIVVDNASSDGSADAIADQFPAVRLIRSAENVGFGHANLLAAAHARGAYLLLLNSDAFLDPGALHALKTHLAENETAACAAPRLRFPDGRPQPSCAHFPTPLSESLAALGVDRWLLRARTADVYGRRIWDADRPQRVDWVMGACVLVRRSALGDEPLFDPRFFMYSEETDLCLRLRRRGYTTWFVPAATAVHVWGASSAAVDHVSLRRFYQSRARFLEKHYGRASAAMFRLALRMGSLLRIASASLLLLARSDSKLERTRARYVALWRDE